MVEGRKYSIALQSTTCRVQYRLGIVFKTGSIADAARAHVHAGVTKFLKPSVAGFLLQKELDYLDGAVAQPKRPFVAIVGGSKVSSKIGVIESLINKVDKIILGCVPAPANLPISCGSHPCIFLIVPLPLEGSGGVPTAPICA